MKSKIFQLLFRLAIIISAVLGLFAFFNPYGIKMQFWFFTIQTNIFVAIIETILCVCLILEMCGKPTKLLQNKVFSTIQLMVSFFITITGVIYCFVLAPAGIIFSNKPVSLMLDVRNILLHVVVPVLSVVGYCIYSQKNFVSTKTAFIFLIYPFVYFLMVNFRVWFGGSPFYDGTLYPYFFIDPTIGNQGWGMVAIYIAIIIIFFYALARLFIYINNKLAKKQSLK